MSAAPMRRLSALFVNHNSGAWTQRAVESLMIEWERDGRDLADLEVIVFDSGSRAGESTWWRSLRHLGARVITSDENIGYASGLNRAFERSSGGPQDAVALLNPDLYFLPGSIRPLLERLEQERGTALVAPRCFVDETRSIHLPPNELPSPSRELADWLAMRFPLLGRALAELRSKQARAWWGSEVPLRAEMLSGACLFLRRGTIEAMGSPMDSAYPLYFEDADLCARLRSKGFALELVPQSEVLHHWSRAAGPHFEGEVAQRWQTSRARYLAVHHNTWSARLAMRAHSLLKGLFHERSARPIHPVQDLGTLHEPPRLELGEARPYQLELSLTSHWGLSAGVLCETEHYTFPARTWSWLFPGTYYLRATDARSGAFIRAWCFHKQSAARSWPIDPDSLPRPHSSSPSMRERQPGERVG